MSWTLQRILPIFLTLLVSGCQLYGKTVASVGLGPNEVKTVGVMAATGENPSALLVDIAFAYGDAASAVLAQSDALTWFKEQAGFCQNYSNQLDVIRLELPMGYSALLSKLPKQHKTAQTIFVFIRDVGKAEITKLKTPWISAVDGQLILLTAPPGSASTGNAIVAVKGAKTLC
tara:strand:- start:59 stop:580 length:522 start_codon:yes stop_codon:yes gene_type:complete